MTGYFYGSAVYLAPVKVYYIPSITQVCSSRDTVAKSTITMELLSSGVQGSLRSNEFLCVSLNPGC